MFSLFDNMQETIGGLVLRDSQFILGNHADIENKNKNLCSLQVIKYST